MENDNTQKKIEELEKRLKLLEQADNIDSLKHWREKIVGREYGADDSAVDIVQNFTVNLISGAGSVTTLDLPDGFIELIKPNGDRVRVPYYALSRF